MTPIASKKHLVKEVFENPRRYFGGRQYDVRIRTETVRSWTEGRPYQHVLDIGCGDGSISLPLIGPGKHLTLMDLSESMLSIVRSNLPRQFVGDVQVRNEDVMTAPLPPGSFDLIICLGVIAHVDSPEELFARIAKLMKPGGSLILEFTDSFDLAGRMARLFGSLRKLVAPPRYAVNRLSHCEVSRLASRNNLRLVSRFRYGLPELPGMQFLSHGMRYEIVRRMSGTCNKNKNIWWGNEYICLFTLDLSRLPNLGSNSRAVEIDASVN